MDCSKTWGLMMTSLDGDITDSDALKLESHLSGCSSCEKEFTNLKSSLSEIGQISFLAPATLEKTIASKLCCTKQKEKSGMLPYVVSPSALLIGLLALLLFNGVKSSPLAMMNETANVISFILKVLQSFSAVIQYFFKVLYLREVLILSAIIAVISFAVFITKNIKKANISGFSWRASK